MRLAIFLLLFTTSLHAQTGELPRQWNEPVAPFRISGNLYYVGAADIASYLITTPRGHIVIDGGFEETAPQILANIRTLGFRTEDVKILLNSHAHLDHAGGLAMLKKETRATLHASAADVPLLARGGLDDPQFGNRYPFPPVEADRLVHHGDTIRLGGTTLTAHITPGHTRGCTTWETNAGGKNVVILCSPSIPSEYVLTRNPRYPDAVADYRRQFEILEALSPDIYLGSHGAFFGLTEKRKSGNFIDPEGYRAFIETMERRFHERVRKEQEQP